MMPGAENTPLTIDAQYVPGFNWDRNPTIRLVGDWNKTVWYGISIEESGGRPAGRVRQQIPTAVPGAAPGFATNFNNTCTGCGLLNCTTTCTNNIAPDIVEKLAFDPGWGHYEVLGLQRWFADDVTKPVRRGRCDRCQAGRRRLRWGGASAATCCCR